MEVVRHLRRVVGAVSDEMMEAPNKLVDGGAVLESAGPAEYL